MSLDMTFRQKLIRIGCCAAICGLSISFLIGEAVDQEAKLLRTWAPDAHFFPEQYLPLRPLELTLNSFDSGSWRDQLVASNSLSTPGEADSPELVLAKSYPVPAIHHDEVVVNSAAATRTAPPIAVVAPAPLLKKAPSYYKDNILEVPAAAKAKEPELANAEVEKILVSIHNATTKLSAPPAKVAARDSAPEVTSDSSPKEEEAPKAEKKKKKNKNSMLASLGGRAPLEEVVSEPDLQSPALKRGWILQGRILVSTGHTLEPGHFEVGLFSKIDPEGNPIGFPLPQQILPAGQTQFHLEIPAKVEHGYLFAEFVAAKGGKRTLVAPSTNPWQRNSHQVAELIYKPEDAISSVAAAPAQEWKVQGTVSAMMFNPNLAPTPQGEVVVRVRGRKEATRTDSRGNFTLQVPKMKGTLFLEVLKPGFHPTVLSVDAGESKPLQIEIASRHAFDQISQRLGANQESAKGLFIGTVRSAEGAPVRGVTASLSLKADGPFYFDEDGVVTRDARATASSGKFLFLNVEAGTGYLETSINGEAVAPIQVSSVEGGELIQKSLVPVSGSLKGRIFNPVAAGGKMAPLIGARVRLDGASDWVSSDSYGAFSIGPMKWMKGEKVSLEVTAEKFNNHRYQVSADQLNSAVNLFAFPASYLANLARSMDVDIDPYAGVVIGKVEGQSLRIDALADHSTVNNAKDFYFDSRGKLRGSHEMTDPRFGTYIIFNVPKGRAILQGNDSGGVMRYSEALFANPSSINIQMD